MVSIKPVYELTLFKPFSEDATESAVLTQREDELRSFVVTSLLSDEHPYLTVKSGRRGRYDPRTKHVDTGSVNLTIVNKRETGGGTTNDRFFTRFFGNAYGRVRTGNVRAQIRISLDGGATYEPDAWFTGRVFEHQFLSQVEVQLEIRDLREELDIDVFTGAPVLSLDYAQPSILLPTFGPVAPYGDFQIAEKLEARMIRNAFLAGQGFLQIHLKAARGALSNLVTEALREAMTSRDTEAEAAKRGYAVFKDARVRLRVVAGGAEGEFQVGCNGLLIQQFITGFDRSVIGTTVTAKDPEGREYAVGVGISELPATDPAYLAMPSHHAEVEFLAIRVGPPTKLSPIYIDTVKIATFKRNLLEGKFGRLDESGQPRRVFPFDVAAFDGLENDPSAATGRFAIEQPYKLRDFLEKHLCLPHDLGYRISGNGEFVPFDTRLPETLAGIETIGVDDVALGAEAVRPRTGIANAITRLLIKHYLEVQLTPAEVKDPDLAEFARGISASRIVTREVENEFLFDRFGEIGETLEIDALGWRAHARISWKQFAGVEFGPGELRNHTPEEIARNVEQLAATFRSPNVDGPLIVEIKCRRTAPVLSCYQGMLRIVNHPGIPNAATNRQGGNRVMRCLERSETVDGLHVTLLMLDMGSDLVAVPPVFGAIGQNADDPRHTIDVAITLNVLGETAEISMCVTDQATAVRPADDDARWQHAADVAETGTSKLPRNPARRRVWFRARTTPSERDSAKLVSEWVYPAGTGYVDTQALSTPTGVTADASGRAIATSCTPGEAEYPLLPLIATSPAAPVAGRDRPLPAGSSRYVFEELPAGVYNIGWRHVDPYGGDSLDAVLNNVATEGAAQLLEPRNVHIAQGSRTAVADRLPNEANELGFGLEVAARAVEMHAMMKWQLARDIDFAEIEIERTVPPGVERVFLSTPLDGIKRFVRPLHTRDGYVDSNWASIVSAYPTVLQPSLGKDLFAGVWGFLSVDPTGVLHRTIGTNDPDTDGAYFEISIGESSSGPYPEVDETDTFIPFSAMPSTEVVLDSEGQPVRLMPGEIALMTVRGWSQINGLSTEVYDWEGSPSGLLEHYGLLEVKVIRNDDGTVTLRINRAELTAVVVVYDVLADDPLPNPPLDVDGKLTDDGWPLADHYPSATLYAGETDYTTRIPDPSFLRRIQLEPKSEDLQVTGLIRRITIDPTAAAPDRVVSFRVDGNEDNGAAVLRGEVVDRLQSIRVLYRIEDIDAPLPITDSEVQASADIHAVSGSFAIALPAGTVPLNKRLRAAVAGYSRPAGVGPRGATDHGEIKRAEWLREKAPVEWKLIEADDTNDSTGYLTVQLVDPTGIVDQVVRRTKAGEASAVEAIEAGPYTNGQQFTAGVAKIEKHQSSIEYIARYVRNGQQMYVSYFQGGYDKGAIPDIKIIPRSDETAATASCSVQGDADTFAVKLKAWLRSAYPGNVAAASEVRATTAIIGRTFTPVDVGVLLSGLLPGQEYIIAGLGYGPNGEESSDLARAEALFSTMLASLEPVTATEDGGTMIATYGVLLKDRGGQAERLLYKKRDAGTPWPTVWSVKTVTPAHNTEYQETIMMREGHGAQIMFAVEQVINGQLIVAPTAESPVFDPGLIANVTSCDVGFDADDLVRVNVRADADTRADGVNPSIVIKVAIGGDPGEPTLGSNNGALAARSGSITSDVVCDPGSEAWVRAAAVNDGGELGPSVGPFRALNPEPPAPPPTIIVNDLSCALEFPGVDCSDPGQVLVGWDVTAPAGYTVTIDLYADYLGEFEYHSTLLNESASHSGLSNFSRGAFEVVSGSAVNYMVKLTVKNSVSVIAATPVYSSSVHAPNEDVCL